jgi:AraC-like DNA-binding protein
MPPLVRPRPQTEPSFVSKSVTEARRYYINLAPKPASELVVVCGGCERMRADYIIDRKDFPFWAIECVAEGTGTLELSGQTFHLSAGMAFAYSPHMPHRITSHRETPMLKYFIDFTGKAAERLVSRSALSDGRCAQLSSPQEVIDVFEWLQREGLNEAVFRPEVCAALLPVLLMKIDQHAVPYGTLDFRALETYERAKRLIQERYLALRSAEEAARACGVDASYLCRLFRRFDRTTPYRFITKLKMNRAATLLLDERMLVKEAADALGYADAFHFSRTFKRVYGIPPDRFIHQTHGRSS